MEQITRNLIGKRINETLAIKDVKQKDLAKAIGVTDNTISYFVSGKRTPNTEQIIEIAKFLNVSADYLLGLSSNMTTDTELQAVCEYIGLDDVITTFIKDTVIEIKKYYKEKFEISDEDLIVENLPLLSAFTSDLLKYTRLYYVLCKDLKSNKDGSIIALDLLESIVHCVASSTRKTLLKELTNLSYNNTSGFFDNEENENNNNSKLGKIGINI